MKAMRHLGIVVSDIEKSLHFYRDILGLQIKRDMLEEGDFIDTILGLKNVQVRTVKMSADGGSLIELLYFKSRPKKPKLNKKNCNIGTPHVAFTVANIDAEYKKFKKSGVKFNSAPQISPDGKAKVAFCRDPDGVPIELVEELN